MLPISSSPVAFGPFHARHAGSTVTPQTIARTRTVPQDSVDISVAGRQQATAAVEEQTGEPAETPSGDTSVPTPGTPQEPDATARRAIAALRQRDQEVRQHEQAHLLVAGPYAKGAPSYTYATGPDGQRYAVGGEVPIDLSSVPGNPQATLQKALTIRRAALAPTDPSTTDQAVAAKATTLAAQAQQELLQVQSTGSLTTSPAGQAATRSTPEQPSAAPSTSAAHHVCGPNCQIHNAGQAPVANVTIALQPLVMATKALQSYQLAAQNFSV
jgi:SprA-related family